MKKLMTIIVASLIFLLTFTIVFLGTANAIELEPRIGYMIYNDSEMSAGASLELRIKGDVVFLSLQRDDARQFGGDFNIDSIGIGFEKSFWKHFSAYIKGAYFMFGDNPGGNEKINYELRRIWIVGHGLSDPGWFKHTKIEYDNAFGGEIGGSAQANLYDVYPWKPLKNIDVGLTAAYRFLRVHEAIYGWNDGGAPGVTGWMDGKDKDKGGWFVGGSINIKTDKPFIFF